MIFSFFPERELWINIGEFIKFVKLKVYKAYSRNQKIRS